MRNVFILSAILIIAMVVFNACTEKPIDDPNGPGNGSMNNPFKVATVEDLKRVGTGEIGPGELAWGRDKHYKQIANIDLSGISNWTPIGSSASFFTGTYHGGGYTISNLTISGSENDRGLFGTVSGTVSNVRLNGVSITGKNNVGCVAGTLQSHGIIEYCSVNNIEIYARWSVGGIAGNVCINALVNSCIVAGGTVNGTGTVNIDALSGGVAGTNSGTIKNCYATIDVNGIEKVGGIAGSNTGNGTLQYCYATGNVTSNTRNVGGIAGDNSGKIQNCVALNSEVKRQSASSSYTAPNAGRITGNNFNAGTLSNNYARYNMALKEGGAEEEIPLGTESTPTGIHGADVLEADYHGANSDIWWNSVAGFAASAWLFDAYRLPWLKGFEGVMQNPKVINN